MSIRVRSLTLGFIACAVLGGCGFFSDEEVLPGDRVSVRDQAGVTDSGGTAPATPLIPAVAAGDWTQTSGNAAHNSGHLAGPTTLSEVWRADAGAGNSTSGAITSAPIVVGGSVFTLDADAQVSAFDAASGARRWQMDVTPEGESSEEGFGGGLAAEGARLFVTTGFGEVLGLDQGSGEIVWRQKLGAPLRAAPAVGGGLLVAVTRDNRAFGLDAATGAVRWRLQGVGSDAGLLGGASPALAQGLTVLPFGSGEVVAAEPTQGRRVWTAVLSGGRRGLARSSISDVTGGPVVVGPLVVAANQSGRMVAIDGRNGRRVWTRSIGATRPIWPAGDTLFVMSDDGKLIRLATASGGTVWESPLPLFEDPEDRSGPITYSGPILISGKVLLTDSLGNLHSFDAASGVGSSVELLSGGSGTGLVVSGNTVYILDDDGTLHAFR